MACSKNDSICVSWLSRSRRLMHIGPIFGMGLVVFLSLCGIYTIVTSLSHRVTAAGIANLLIFPTLCYLILKNYALAAFYGPGFVNHGWKPRLAKDESSLQYCAICDGFKPPRAHHCRTCGRCVLKMDHHCPWINSCVGHLNHGLFLHFVILAPIGCLYCLCICGYRIYFVITRSFALFRRGYDFTILFSYYEIFTLVAAVGLAIGVILAVGGLAVCQLRSIARNRTAIEDWILIKAEDRRDYEPSAPKFVYPYDLGWRQNMRQVLTWSATPVGDGFVWPLKRGCGEFDLTIEQLHQKEAKSRMAREFTITYAYTGSQCPITFGCRVCCCPPCSGENRLAVCPDDRVLVTRAHRKWYYGQLLSCEDNASDPNYKIPLKGWFPRICARPKELPAVCKPKSS